MRLNFAITIETSTTTLVRELGGLGSALLMSADGERAPPPRCGAGRGGAMHTMAAAGLGAWLASMLGRAMAPAPAPAAAAAAGSAGAGPPPPPAAAPDCPCGAAALGLKHDAGCPSSPAAP